MSITKNKLNLTNFDEVSSVEKVQSIWKKYQQADAKRRKVTIELAEELWKAKEFYKNPGFRADLNKGQSATDGNEQIGEPKFNSFKEYLDAVGIKQITAYKWFEKLIQENKEPKEISYQEFESEADGNIDEKQIKSRIIVKSKKEEKLKEFKNSMGEPFFKKFDLSLDKRKSVNYIEDAKLDKFLEKISSVRKYANSIKDILERQLFISMLMETLTIAQKDLKKPAIEGKEAEKDNLQIQSTSMAYLDKATNVENYVNVGRI